MIPCTTFAGQRVAVFGLGRSGLSTARALAAGSAEAVLWDDGENSREEARKAGFEVADLSVQDWSRFAALVLAPGVPLTHPKPHWSVQLAHAAGVSVIGDIELFSRERQRHAPDSPFIAITGTNGKSTTTALVAHMLRSAGFDVQMGGNIGIAILDLEPPDAMAQPRRVHVIECSSYQIDLAPSLCPSVGVLLNISPDHLDRHGSIEHYAAVKERLVEAARTAVVGLDDRWSRAIVRRLEAVRGPGGSSLLEVISGQAPVQFGWGVIDGQIGTMDEPDWHPVADLAGIASLRGAHNAQNAAAAIAATRELLIGEPQVGLHFAQTVQRAFASFPGLAHRLEQIAMCGPVAFLNDSKATNADSTATALASLPGNIFWIVGGLPKTGGIAELAEFFPRIARAYLIGQASEEFAATLEGKVPYRFCGDLATAVPLAAADAQAMAASLSTATEAAATGTADAAPVVVFSPACASFDQFRNFEMRGDRFCQLVLGLPGIERRGRFAL